MIKDKLLLLLNILRVLEKIAPRVVAPKVRGLTDRYQNNITNRTSTRVDGN